MSKADSEAGRAVQPGASSAMGSLGAITPYPVVQLGWSVPDLDAAMADWFSLAGVGPFYVQRHVPLRNVMYRGQPTTYDHSCAIAWWGGIEVELMQQHCDRPSHVRDVVPDGGYGLASVSWFAPDLDAETRRLEALGFPLCWSGEFGIAMSARWFDARHLLGMMIEVFPEHPDIRGSFAVLEAASEAWDGDRPIRGMEELLPAEFD